MMFEVQFNWIGQYEIILLSVQFFNFSIKICVTFHLIQDMALVGIFASFFGVLKFKGNKNLR